MCELHEMSPKCGFLTRTVVPHALSVAPELTVGLWAHGAILGKVATAIHGTNFH